MDVTNNHFKSLILQWNNFTKNNSMPPEDLAFEFVSELRVSNLILPVNFDEKGISFPSVITPDKSRFLPLFTDMDEFSKYSKDMEAVSNDINYYVELINSAELDGMVINSEGENVVIGLDLLNRIQLLAENNHDEGFDYAELKDIAYQTSNEELLEFIRDNNNIYRYDEVMNLMKNSTLLNLISSKENLDEYFRNGIITVEDAGPFGLTSIKIGRENYGVIFTDRNSIADTIDFAGNYYYMQVTDLYEFIKLALEYDLDGIIINPALEDYFIPRNALIKAFNEDMINPDFSKASDCAFKIR